jgi:hypothetical protein
LGDVGDYQPIHVMAALVPAIRVFAHLIIQGISRLSSASAASISAGLLPIA